MQQIAEWLEKLGMSEYAERFAENKIDVSVLRHLTDQDLKDIGVALGHRRKILAAITEFAGAAPAASKPVLAAEPKTRDSAERRQVTVLFSDLVGSTALSARMDPEDLREVISAYQKCVAETVQRFAGFVAKYMGDGVLVYFGYPQAHEDDAEQAVRAGLELIQAVGALKSNAPLQTRVGIATGLVVVGDLIGSGSAQEQAVVGETPNLAARLQGIAEPDNVIIAESTRKLIGNLFELQDLGAKDLKGIAAPVRAWAALRASSVESRFEALRTATTPLVGREEDIGLLMRRWTQAKAGDGCVVLISGEPGIGKSRLVESLHERISTEPHTRIRFFCSPHHQDSALHPAIAQLEHASGFRREDTADQRLNKLEALLAQATNDVGGVAPLFADLLSIPTGERYPAFALTPQKRKQKTLQALAAQAEGLALQHPVLMVFEDVHWSDPTTRELLDVLIERAPRMRLLALITYRPEFSPTWIGVAHVALMTLSRLPPRHRSEMITLMTGGKALPREITDQIVERTDGIPLFIEELTKTVVESGIVADAGGRYALASTVEIPTSLHASLLARLDRLAPTREIAQIAATIGRSFSHELISAVAQMPLEKLDEGLEQLVRAELIFQHGTPPNAEYSFKHALVQDAAYSTLLRGTRRQLHARIASTLETEFVDIVARHPAVLAQHCTEAGLNEKAISYWLKAGQQSVGRSAMGEAVAQFQKGLDLLRNLPHTALHQKQELDLRVSSIPALIGIRGYSSQDVGETITNASALAEQLNNPEYLAPLLYGSWVFNLVRAELNLALTPAKEMERIGEKDHAWRLLGYGEQGIIRFFLGELDAARTLFEKSAGLAAHRQLYSNTIPDDPHLVMLAYLGATLILRGHVDQGRAKISEALSEGRRLTHSHIVALVLRFATWAEWVLHSPREEQRYADELVSLSEEHGFPLWPAWAMVHRGSALAELGLASGSSQTAWR
jgi:class 3 adenylate cyclase